MPDGAARDEARQAANIAGRAHAQMVMRFEQPALEREMLRQAAAAAGGLEQKKFGQARRRAS